jgi:hypothetical protein
MRDADSLRALIGDLAPSRVVEAFCLAAEDELHWMEPLCRELSGTDNVSAYPPSIPIVLMDPVVTFEMSGPYFRAVAKCVFHYLIASNIGTIRGDEPQFDTIRTFIRRGGTWQEHVSGQDGTAIPLPIGTSGTRRIVVCPNPYTRPWHFCHMLSIEWNEREVTGWVQFFWSPGGACQTYAVRLSTENSCLAGNGAAGHFFIYDPNGKQGRFYGQAMPTSISLRRLQRPV